MNAPKIERVIAYIDGFNLYKGIKDSGFDRYKWLDLDALLNNIIKGNQTLVKIRYFTTLATDNADRRMRQKTYIKALETKASVEIHYGKFKNEAATCGVCGNNRYERKEKMTDVNIATHLMIDYFEGIFDTAILISGDTDLLPPMKYINEHGGNTRVFVAFPPSRANDEVKESAKGSIIIGRKMLSDSQFEDTVLATDGTNLIKPAIWV